MASSDPQRLWFEEIVDALRSRWHREVPFAAMTRLRDNLDEMLQRISLTAAFAGLLSCSGTFCGFITRLIAVAGSWYGCRSLTPIKLQKSRSVVVKDIPLVLRREKGS